MHDDRRRDGPPDRGAGKPRGPAPESTGAEDDYLWRLRADATPVKVGLVSGDEVIGTVTYFDRHMVKVEALAGPSLFIRKQEIRWLAEVGD